LTSVGYKSRIKIMAKRLHPSKKYRESIEKAARINYNRSLAFISFQMSMYKCKIDEGSLKLEDTIQIKYALGSNEYYEATIARLFEVTPEYILDRYLEETAIELERVVEDTKELEFLKEEGGIGGVWRIH
jgi:predicted house-cleaning noncanonical NTP pyrophosphatase (MazG superfamily)